MMITGIANTIKVVESDVEPLDTESIIEVVESESIENIEVVDVIETESIVEEIEVVEHESDKTIYRVTAYCSCSKCCGNWALNRPKDENGNDIVIGASNVPLTPRVSCASPLPFGTKINLEGYGTVIVQDRTARWVVDKYGDNIIDIYVNNHDDIKKIGRQFMEGVIVE